MTEQTPETPERQPGIAELSVLSVLNQGWEGVSIDQKGPDGTETIAMLIFFVCPICKAVIPTPDDEHPFIADHSAFHIKQARDFDALNEVIRILQGLPEQMGSSDG